MDDLIISEYNAYGIVSLEKKRLKLILFSRGHRFDFEHTPKTRNGDKFLASVLFNVGKPEPFTFDVAFFNGSQDAFEKAGIRDALIKDAAVMEAEIT